MKAPNKIYAKARPDGTGVDVTADANAYWPDLEYIRNDAPAMDAAGWVPVEILPLYNDLLEENADLHAKLATARSDALEYAAKVAQDAVFANGPYEAEAVSDAIHAMKDT